MKKILNALLMFAMTSVAIASTNTSLLFFQTDVKGHLQKNADNSYTLTLIEAPEYVSYFSNRPERKTGLVALKKFLSLWKNKDIKDNFRENPPNVAFAMMPVGGRQQSFIATVYDPHYLNKNVTYRLRLIENVPLKTGPMTHLNIFFDDIHWNPGGFGNG